MVVQIVVEASPEIDTLASRIGAVYSSRLRGGQSVLQRIAESLANTHPDREAVSHCCGGEIGNGTALSIGGRDLR